MNYINYIYLQHEQKEYIIPFNELIYHLKDTKNKIPTISTIFFGL